MSFGDEQYPPGKGELTYGSYLKIPELTSLQHCLSDPEQHDEPLFIIIHQVYELWFKLILHELDAVQRSLLADSLPRAIHLLGRCAEVMKVLVAQVAVLETILPMDFLGFRDHLKPASGFQSAQFRELEFLCGLKDARKLENYDLGSPERAKLEQRLAEPSLSDAFHELLLRRGLGHNTIGNLEVIRQVYESSETHFDLLLLAERMIEFDEQLLCWRQRHVAMVERMIGDKEGTGGSEGAAYLRSTLGKRCFPELWAVRNMMTKRS